MDQLSSQYNYNRIHSKSLKLSSDNDNILYVSNTDDVNEENDMDLYYYTEDELIEAKNDFLITTVTLDNIELIDNNAVAM